MHKIIPAYEASKVLTNYLEQSEVALRVYHGLIEDFNRSIMTAVHKGRNGFIMRITHDGKHDYVTASNYFTIKLEESGYAVEEVGQTEKTLDIMVCTRQISEKVQ